jgi:hypothetical protein
LGSSDIAKSSDQNSSDVTDSVSCYWNRLGYYNFSVLFLMAIKCFLLLRMTNCTICQI